MAVFDPRAIAEELSPSGPIARRLSGYEHREEQVRMAEEVAETFSEGGVLVVEAGTGTGKSLAYLVPAIHWAHEHHERVIVSTNTINLQEQLVGTDLPFLAEHLGVPFNAVLVKGRTNYLCLRKLSEVRASPSLLPEDAVRRELAAILEWSEKTSDGSLADLEFVPRSEVWEQVATEHDDCLRTRCPEYERCFFYKARREAATADVLVVNHHLLMADLALRSVLGDDLASGVLPGAARLVVDEAHHLEDVTTDHFGVRVTLRRIERLLWRLQHPRHPERGVLPALLGRLAAIARPEDLLTARGAARWIEEGLRPRIPELVREAARCFDQILLDVAGELRSRVLGESEDRQLRIVPELCESELWRRAVAAIGEIVGRLDAFGAEVDPVIERLAKLSEPSIESTQFLAKQLEALAGRLAAVALDLGTFAAESPDLCRWMSVETAPAEAPRLALSLAPVEAGPRLRDSLFRSFDSVVLTSATLSVERRFDYFSERTGVSLLPPESVEKLRLESPYHFADQALIAIPADLPAPDAPGYEAALHRTIEQTVEASGGGAFVLFTSYASLTRAHGELASRFRARGCLVLRQGEASRSLLLERFRADRTAVLFATDSFWEGVDVRGEGLRAVVIARLPFRVPTEPIVQARSETIEERGGSAFDDYAVPQAVIKLRQGFGRLIRSHDDTGVVVIADSRVARKRYGEVFLNSLPPARLAIGTAEEVFREVGRFFRR